MRPNSPINNTANPAHFKGNRQTFWTGSSVIDLFTSAACGFEDFLRFQTDLVVGTHVVKADDALGIDDKNRGMQ